MTTYLELDVRDLPSAEQFGAWAATMQAYDLADLSGGPGFEVQNRAWLLPPIIVSHARLGPFAAVRTVEALSRDCFDSITFQLFVAGGMEGEANGQPFVVAPGDIALQDASLPWRATTTRSETVVVNLPRSFLDEILPEFPVHGLVLRGGIAKLLTEFMRALPDVLAVSSARASEPVPAVIRDLLVAALRTVELGVERGSDREHELKVRVCRYVTRNLGAKLDVPAICAAIAVSRAGLYRAFEGEGGIASYVLRRRLARMRRLLGNRSERRSIAALAASCGFPDISYFTRAFRLAYGTTPAAFRRVATSIAAPLAIVDEVQDKFRTWVEQSNLS